jgi:hypothetical protein
MRTHAHHLPLPRISCTPLLLLAHDDSKVQALHVMHLPELMHSIEVAQESPALLHSSNAMHRAWAMAQGQRVGIAIGAMAC